ncbi:MAG: hypothetical protein K2M23_02055, partial [Alphaproteobacteria bacterium]|nr:hypothetical protein [Alphaproteobacteria bacterium]
EYTDDEYLLRLYTNKYFEMYEYLVNEFVMTYEYANGTASNLYPVMEKEMQILGKPNAKLQILIELYNAIQRAGGVKAVLKGIAIKDEEDLKYAPEIEATLIPLEATTTVIVSDETLYDNGSSSTTYYTEEQYNDDLLVDSENSLDEEDEYADSDEYDEEEEDEEYAEDDDDDIYDNSIATNTEKNVFIEDDMETVEVMPISENIKTFENNLYEDDLDDEEEYADSDEDEDDEEDDEELADSDEEDEYDDEEDIEYSEVDEDYYEESES